MSVDVVDVSGLGGNGDRTLAVSVSPETELVEAGDFGGTTHVFVNEYGSASAILVVPLERSSIVELWDRWGWVE